MKTRTSLSRAAIELLLLPCLLIAIVVVWPSIAHATVDGPGHGREWELVTTAENGASSVSGAFALDADGERIAFGNLGAVPDAEAGSFVVPHLAVRHPDGWVSRPVTYPHTSDTTFFQTVKPVLATPDFTTWVWASSRPLLPGAPIDPNIGIYQGAVGGPLSLLANSGSRSLVMGASEDLRHIWFRGRDHLVPADANRTTGTGVYELADGVLRLVDVGPSGTSLSSCGTIVGGLTNTAGAMSSDGRRVFMTSPGTGCATVRRRIYLSEDGGPPREVSVSRCTRVNCNAAADVLFAGATPSGSMAFFVTTQQLTDDDVDASRDLYRYDVENDTLERLSVGAPGVLADVPTGAPVRVARSGERVYFIALGKLVADQGVAGSPNVYVLDEHGLRFVTTLQAGERWVSGGVAAEDDSRITPDGDFLTFTTSAPLTADDTDATRDVYRYDADDGSLLRVSKGLSAGNGELDADVLPGTFVATPMVGQRVRGMSADGRRVFFATVEALVPEDGNGAIDVYEWADGSVELISSGGGNDMVIYVGASADGSSVYFTTHESLVAADRDNGDQDLYAARLDGGFPDPPVLPSNCEDTDSCPLAPVTRPSRSSPGSLTASERGALRLLAVAPLGRAALRRAATKGSIGLTVRVPLAGVLTARAYARLDGRSRTVAHQEVAVRRAGTQRLRLVLSKAARRRLARRGALRLRVVLSHSRVRRPAQVTVKLDGASR